jgi:transcriptional regulator NrdR family protein
MPYKCPKCGSKETTRNHFGPEGDGRNLERSCDECYKTFLTVDAEHFTKKE